MGKKSVSGITRSKVQYRPKTILSNGYGDYFFLFIAVNLVAFLLMSSGLIGYLPRIDELENPIDKYAS